MGEKTNDVKERLYLGSDVQRAVMQQSSMSGCRWWQGRCKELEGKKRESVTSPVGPKILRCGYARALHLRNVLKCDKECTAGGPESS